MKDEAIPTVSYCYYRGYRCASIQFYNNVFSHFHRQRQQKKFTFGINVTAHTLFIRNEQNV